MFNLSEIGQSICLVPIIGGSIYSILTVWSAGRFFNQSQPTTTGELSNNFQPAATVLKPVRGLEKELKANLSSICTQDYPEYQVVYSVQDPADPALPILEEIQAEFGAQRVSLSLSTAQVGANGKVNNLLGAIAEARHDILIISDSDTHLPANYIATIVAPLANPDVGCVCTPFKLVRGDRWFEKLELLTINADFIPSVIFAEVTGTAKACLGPSIALRRSTLEAVGGLESLADYLVEDYELGRRLWTTGKSVILLPHLIKATVDLKNWQQWWSHQVYWDQNTYLAQPLPFVATILIRAVPFALLLAIARLADPVALSVLAVTIVLRLLTAALVAVKMADEETLRSLYLLPLRDTFGLFFWGLAFTQRKVVWRGVQFKLTSQGKMVPWEL